MIRDGWTASFRGIQVDSTNSQGVREPIVDGIFYPVENLSDLVKELCDNANTSPKGPLKEIEGLIVPHGAYQYTGPLLASGFVAASKSSARRIVLLAPVHREHSSHIYLCPYDFMRTPIGDLPVDHTLDEEILRIEKLCGMDALPYQEEHDLEVLLPFVQHTFPDLPVLPLLLGKTSRKTVQVLAKIIQTIRVSGDCLFIISSNLTDYLPEKSALNHKDNLFQVLETGDSGEILDAAVKGNITACGAGCIAALYRAFDDNLSPLFLDEAASPPYQGADNVVRYGTIVLQRRSQ